MPYNVEKWASNTETMFTKTSNIIYKEHYNNNNNDRLTAFDPGQPG